MADLSDVSYFLADRAAAAVYPNGTLHPSVAAIDVKIYEGWPLPEQLNLDIAGQMLSGGKPVARPGGKCANVSIYPMQGATAVPYQIFNNMYVIVAAVHAMTAALDPALNKITLTGTPSAGEFLTVVADERVIASRTGDTAAAILTALAADLIGNYPHVTATPSVLTVPGAAYLEARLGAPAVMGEVLHRQKQAFMVSIWAPDHLSRTALAIAIDAMIKDRLVVTMPDGSQALVLYNRTNQTDEFENATVYRRDLIYEVEYATVKVFQGVEVTAVGPAISPLDPVQQGFISISAAV